VAFPDPAQFAQAQPDDFFVGPMLKAIAPGACVTEVRFPVWTDGSANGAGEPSGA
jgi:hypothetical protein